MSERRTRALLTMGFCGLISAALILGAFAEPNVLTVSLAVLSLVAGAAATYLAAGRK